MYNRSPLSIVYEAKFYPQELCAPLSCDDVSWTLSFELDQLVSCSLSLFLLMALCEPRTVRSTLHLLLLLLLLLPLLLKSQLFLSSSLLVASSLLVKQPRSLLCSLFVIFSLSFLLPLTCKGNFKSPSYYHIERGPSDIHHLLLHFYFLVILLASWDTFFHRIKCLINCLFLQFTQLPVVDQ